MTKRRFPSAQIDGLWLIGSLALGNLRASRWRTVILGSIIGIGAMLVVSGVALLRALDHSIRHSVTGSIAGDIQIYSAKSKDEIDIVAGTGAEPRLAPLADFAEVRRAVSAIRNVRAIVPMALSVGVPSVDSAFGRAVGALRSTTNVRREGGGIGESPQYEAQKRNVRRILELLCGGVRRDRAHHGSLAPETADIERAISEQFWMDFDRDPYAHLEFLENRVSKVLTDSSALVTRHVGTDPRAFARAFDRMVVIDGQEIPAGRRGFMFSKYVYETQIKLRAVRGLDELKSQIDGHQGTIASSPELKRTVKVIVASSRELLLQIDESRADELRSALQSFLSSNESDAATLLASFFAMNDANFAARYRFFYSVLAPSLELYSVRIGDTMTIQAMSSSGYVRSVNLPVYGTYSFRGLETSPQAGLISMMDLVSFRELHGLLDDEGEGEREIQALRARVDAVAVAVERNDVEATLFGTKQTDFDVVGTGPAEGTVAELLKGTQRRLMSAARSSYDADLLERGPVLNAAVFLRDESKLEETERMIEEAGRRNGLPLKAASWQKAAGILAQFATMMRAVMGVAMLIIFVVTVVVINNALVMATMDRVREIGTLRAVGAHRGTILGVLVLESAVVGIVSGALGAALGGAILEVCHRVGIPAGSAAMQFAFSGPRLFPSAGPAELAFATGVVLAVSIASGVFPAWIAMRVSPREAMAVEG